MSTNDTVLLLASGATGTRPDPAEFAALLTAACADLARQMQADAEGASKAITIEVVGAATEPDAVEVGRAIARCNLLKCAIARRGPELGPGAGGCRHDQRRVRARPAERGDQRCLGLQVRGAPPRTGRRSTCSRAR